MIEAVFFVVSSLILYISLMLMPKNKAKLNLISFACSTLVFMISFWVLATGVVNYLSVTVGITSLSVCNLILSAMVLLYIIRKKHTQKYELFVPDALVVLVLIVIALILGMRRYGNTFNIFSYASDDSARHFSFCKEMMVSGSITRGKYAMYVLDMIFIQALSFLFPEAEWFRPFMLADVMLFFMMGAMFWAWIRRIINGRYSYIAGVLFTLLYATGYPLNNMLYGFEYLGMGILMITFVLWILQRHEYEEIPQWMILVMLSFANVSVLVSYTQFAPVALGGELIYFLLWYGRRKRIFDAEFFEIILFGFGAAGTFGVSYITPQFMGKLWLPIVVIAAVLGLMIILLRLKSKEISDKWQAFREWLSKRKKIAVILASVLVLVCILLGYRYIYREMIVRFVSQEQGMILDGNIYREPYANFLVLLFPLGVCITDVFRKKKNDASVWMVFITLIFSAWMIYCVLNGSIGSYYFYKMHYLFWLLLFGCAFKAVVGATGESRKNIITYLAGAMVLFIISISGVENNISASNEWLWQNNISEQLFGIYNFNIDLVKQGGNVNASMQDMYNRVYEIAEREDTYIPYFGKELRYLREYYYILSGQDPELHPDGLNNHDYPSYDFRGDLEKNGTKYIFVQKGYELPSESYQQDIDVMWMEYENDYGYIYKLD